MDEIPDNAALFERLKDYVGSLLQPRGGQVVGEPQPSVSGFSGFVGDQGAISSQSFRPCRQESFSPPRTAPVIVAGDLDSASEEELPSLQWHPLRDHKLIGLTAIHVDGFTYGPDQVELDLVSVPPRFRFRTNKDIDTFVFRPGKNFEVKLPPKEAFAGVAAFVLSQESCPSGEGVFYSFESGSTASERGVHPPSRAYQGLRDRDARVAHPWEGEVGRGDYAFVPADPSGQR